MSYNFNDVASLMVNLELGTTTSNIGLIQLGNQQTSTYNYTGNNAIWYNYWKSTYPYTLYSTSYLDLCNPGNAVRGMTYTYLNMSKNPNKRVSQVCLDFDVTKHFIYYGDEDYFLIKMDVDDPSAAGSSTCTFYSVKYEPYLVTTGFSSGEVVYMQADVGSSTYELRTSDFSTDSLLYSFSTSPTASMPYGGFRNRLLDTLIFETTANNFQSLICYIDYVSTFNFFIIDSVGGVVWDFQSVTGKSCPYERFKISPREVGNLGNRQIYLYYRTGGSVSDDVCVLDISYTGTGYSVSCTYQSVGGTGYMSDLDFANQYSTGGGSSSVYFLDNNYGISVYNFNGNNLYNTIHTFPTATYSRYPTNIIMCGDDSERYVVFEEGGTNNNYLSFFNCWVNNAVTGWKNANTWRTATQSNTIYIEAAVRMDDGHMLYGGEGSVSGHDIAMLNTSIMAESNVSARLSSIPMGSSGHEYDFVKIWTGISGGSGHTASYLYSYVGSGGASPVGEGILVYFN